MTKNKKIFRNFCGKTKAEKCFKELREKAERDGAEKGYNKKITV